MKTLHDVYNMGEMHVINPRSESSLVNQLKVIEGGRLTAEKGRDQEEGHG
jgi:hypothetical protein